MELKTKEIEIEEKLVLEDIKIKDIKPYPNNAKLHSTEQIGKIRDSIMQFGYNDPIAIDENNIIIEGHGRLDALNQIYSNKDKSVQVIRLKGLDENAKKAYRIAHNKIGMDSDFDLDILKEEFYSLEDTDYFNDTGFNSDEISEIWDKEVKEDDFETPTEPKYKIELGEIWQLGNHRLMCGDSTELKNISKLIENNNIDMILTDPPYGVDYSSKNEWLNSIAKGNRNQTPIKGDKDINIRELIGKFLNLVPLSDYNTIYVFTSGKHIADMIFAFKDIDYYYSQDLKWIKNNHVLGRLDYNPKSENILYGWKGKHKFYGNFQTDVLEFNKPSSSKEHPTMKPIELLSELIKHGSKSGMNVYDAFGGSGSTLIACEQLDRKCYMMELDPIYCSVIIERWEKLTNKNATKLDNGNN